MAYHIVTRGSDTVYRPLRPPEPRSAGSGRTSSSRRARRPPSRRSPSRSGSGAEVEHHAHHRGTRLRRSAGRNRGRDACRRRTATSWRRTSSSTSLAASRRPRNTIKQATQHPVAEGHDHPSILPDEGSGERGAAPIEREPDCRHPQGQPDGGGGAFDP
jgi:hypothetical protein